MPSTFTDERFTEDPTYELSTSANERDVKVTSLSHTQYVKGDPPVMSKHHNYNPSNYLYIPLTSAGEDAIVM